MKKGTDEKYLEICEKMIKLIRSSDYKVAHISKLLGISQPSMSLWMSGRTSMSLESFIMLSSLFGVKIIFPNENENVVKDVGREENIVALKVALEREQKKVMKLEGQVEVLQSLLREHMQMKMTLEQGELLKIK